MTPSTKPIESMAETLVWFGPAAIVTSIILYYLMKSLWPGEKW